MKLEKTDSSVEIGEALAKPRQFAIASSKEAFKILSSGLYNDKILAIIRELSCNAYDAHVAAGKKELPFELHLPTVFEPHFSVKDFGVGLSHEEVMDLYCTYFSSNKSDSNSFVGALGLGSKSPFCYTEGFTITSRYSGKTRIYSAFIGEDGTPNVVLQSELDTPDEQNGLEIIFPVQVNDCYEFENKAKVALEFFDPMPILNAENFNITKTHYTLDSKDKWGYRAEESTHHTSKIRAIQGMVQYSIGNIDKSRMNAGQRQMCELPLDLFFPIGDLSVAASRETLSNDERTIANILKALDIVWEEFLVEAKKKIAACKTLWEARLLIHELTIARGMGGIINIAFNEGKLFGKYPNFELSTANKGRIEINELDFIDLNLSNAWRSYKRNARRETLFSSQERRKVYLAEIARGIGSKDWHKTNIEISGEWAFIINDLLSGADKYINYYLEEGLDKTKAYIISRASAAVSIEKVKADALGILNIIGNPPTMLASELKEKYKGVVDTKVTPKVEVDRSILRFNIYGDIARQPYEGGERLGWLNAWTPVEATALPTGKKYYVALKRLQPTKYEFKYAENFANLIKRVVELQLLDDAKDLNVNIYGFTEDSKLLKESNDWVEFSSHVFAELRKLVTPQKELELSLSEHSFSCSLKGTIAAVYHTKPFAADNKLQQFADIYIPTKTAHEKLVKQDKREALLKLIQQAKQYINFTMTNVLNFEVEWEKVQKAYPLLKYISEGWHQEGNKEICKIVIEYINALETKKKQEEQELEAQTQATFAQVPQQQEEEETYVN